MLLLKKFLFILVPIGLLSGCAAFGSLITTSTPVFPSIIQFEEMPTLGSEVIAVQSNQITSTPKPEKTPPATATLSQLTVNPTKTPDFDHLGEEIDRITSQAGGRWHIIVKEIGGSSLYVRQPDTRINIASVVKVPIALLFFKAIESNGINDDQLHEYLQNSGTGGRTFDQLLRAMLVNSEEDATEILDKYIRSFYNVPAQMKEWQLSGLDLTARRYTAAGVADFFEQLYQGDLVSPTARDLILEYLHEYTPSDEVRIGSISNLLPEGFTIYNKRGSLLAPYVIADCAIIENSEGVDYLMIMFAFQGDPETTYEVLEQAQGEIAQAFWQTIKP